MVEINTGQGIEKINCLVDHEKFEPTPHQLKTVEAFLTSPYKGMLLYHQLGAGKTCTSIIIADTMLKEKLIDKVLILTPGSLRDNWASEYRKKCGSDFADKFIFATYNYFNIRNKLNPHFLERALVIIEEVHNFINGVKNGSLNPVAIFKLLDKADCRILALSGTPIYNYVSEFAILGRLLKPKNISKVILTGGGVLLKGFIDLAKISFQSDIVYADPFGRLESPAFLEQEFKEAGPEFSVAIGIALRKLSENG
jgi:SNF2 family DNA or RNA helicase